jgi:hypothetical protein
MAQAEKSFNQVLNERRSIRAFKSIIDWKLCSIPRCIQTALIDEIRKYVKQLNDQILLDYHIIKY